MLLRAAIVGPRKAGVYAALCWCGGLMISAIGVSTHQLWMLWIGSGVIGGIGLGLGYRRGVANVAGNVRRRAIP
jgi:hypothetical protein